MTETTATAEAGQATQIDTTQSRQQEAESKTTDLFAKAIGEMVDGASTDEEEDEDDSQKKKAQAESEEESSEDDSEEEDSQTEVDQDQSTEETKPKSNSAEARINKLVGKTKTLSEEVQRRDMQIAEMQRKMQELENKYHEATAPKVMSKDDVDWNDPESIKQYYESTSVSKETLKKEIEQERARMAQEEFQKQRQAKMSEILSDVQKEIERDLKDKFDPVLGEFDDDVQESLAKLGKALTSDPDLWSEIIKQNGLVKTLKNNFGYKVGEIKEAIKKATSADLSSRSSPNTLNVDTKKKVKTKDEFFESLF